MPKAVTLFSGLGSSSDLLKARQELSDLKARIANLARCGTQVLYGDIIIPTSMVSVYAVSSLLE